MNTPFRNYDHRVLIAGDFDYAMFDRIRAELINFPEDTAIIIPRTARGSYVDPRTGEEVQTGGKNFPGASAIAEYIAKELGFTVFQPEISFWKQKKRFMDYDIESMLRVTIPQKILFFEQWGEGRDTFTNTLFDKARSLGIPIHNIRSRLWEEEPEYVLDNMLYAS